MADRLPKNLPNSDTFSIWEEALDDLTSDLQLGGDPLSDSELERLMHLTGASAEVSLIQPAWRALTANGKTNDCVLKATEAISFPLPYPIVGPIQYLRVNAPETLGAIASSLPQKENPDVQYELLQLDSDPRSAKYRSIAISLVDAVAKVNADAIWNELYEFGTEDDIKQLRNQDQLRGGSTISGTIAQSLLDRRAKG